MRAQVCRISVCSLDLWAHSLQQNKSLRLFFMFNVYSRVSFGQRKGAQSLAALYEGRRSGLTRQRQQPSGSRVALCWEWSPGSSFGYAAPCYSHPSWFTPQWEGQTNIQGWPSHYQQPPTPSKLNSIIITILQIWELSPKKFKGFSRVMESVGSRTRIESQGLDPEHSAMEPSFVC